MTLGINQESVNDRAKLLMHRIAARQLAVNPSLVDEARARVRVGVNSPDYVEEWREVLALDVAEIRTVLTRRSEKMDRLRLSSPFGLVLDFKDPAFRRRIWRLARKGISGTHIPHSVSDVPATDV